MTAARPVFVVGCPRSGTTMLQLMLHAHRRLAVPPETRFVLEAYRRRRAFGDLADVTGRDRLARWIVGREQTRFADLGLDAEDTIRRITTGPGTLGAAFATVFQAYADRFGKARWGDKRPAYLQNLDVILRLFPDAQIINVIRDGRACVASLKEMTWHREDVPGTVAAWARAVDEAHRAARRLPANQWHSLRYEDLVADPHRELTGICAFLGEDYDPAMTRPSAVADVAVPAFKTWHEHTHEPVTTRRVESWRRRLTAEEIALCETALASRLRACGYDLTGTGRTPRTAMIRYGLSTTRHRLAPAKRLAERTALSLRPEPPVAYVPA
ncbi:sulfotransferase family protein [Nucisporomicrobium flavum]|uniref:sulfotransferase family protein n=1 Tax=Nucisporomicrobium flavum TaxID=2785915 RepID=UPI0018F33040|nr:sulfotransferase [Nucisporomicrobium flavum]